VVSTAAKGYGKARLDRLLTAAPRYCPSIANTLPRNADVADQFDLLADLMELTGAESFRVLAYRRAATRMRETSGSVAELALAGKAKDLQGIGKTIEEKIVQVVEGGDIQALTKKKGEVPPEVVSFMRLPGLGPKTAARIWRELGVTTLEDLKSAAEQERLRTLTGLGPKSEERILKALAFHAENPDEGRRLLGEGLPAVLAVVSVLCEHAAAVKVSEAGSVRRRKETFRDLDIIATATEPGELTDYFTKLRWVAEVAAKGETKATVVGNDGLRFDLRVVPPESYGNLLQHFTGSKEHNVALREDAVRRGLSISEYGVTTVETGEVFHAEDEDRLYEFLGYQPIPAELRENAGELAAARAGELPELVRLEDLRGDLHTHTHWSADGKNTLEEMVRAAEERGYAYYAITDHSHYLRDARFAAQLEEIAALQERVGIQILRGIEANIRTNGEVDVDEELLAQLDWVVASVHAARETSPTERVLAAMENPYVDCIGHLTGRKLRKRGPSEVDVGRVIEKALETGTFLEIDSQPDRLDLRDVHARAAKEAGLKLAITSDAHQLKAQGYVELGIGQARRGWLTKDDVLNTRTWKQIERLKKKRPRST
jgi:DNA polymerase (family 10)